MSYFISIEKEKITHKSRNIGIAVLRIHIGNRRRNPISAIEVTVIVV
jgi:hypothetical protein